MQHRVLLSLILLLALIELLLGSLFCYTSTMDTATVGLMSVNIVAGDRPLFFYGQPYFGALEAYLAALYIYLFGFSEFTVSLSPISFSLGWILFSFLLFSRIQNRTAGLIAASCIAFSGYYIFWFSVATYGGYSAIMCLGTALLWLSLRVLQENVKNRALVLHSLCIGILMGLGIWVHALTFPYMVIAVGILGIFALRERFRIDIILSFCLIPFFALAGFIPFYIETGSIFGGISERVHVTLPFMTKAIAKLFGTNIYELVVWNFIDNIKIPIPVYLIKYGSFAILVIAAFLAVFSLLTTRKQHLKRKNYLVAFSFCLLFILLYVQHHLALVKAPRYAISFWSMLLCIIWSIAIVGQTRRSLKIVSITLFGAWLLYQVTGTVIFVAQNYSSAQEEQKTIHDIVKIAHERNLKSVVIYGDYLVGLKGQKLSMFAQNKIVFANADTERYLPNAQFTETDINRGYLTTEVYKKSVENNLKDLGVLFTEDKIHEYVLFSNVLPDSQYEMRAIPSEELHLVSPVDKETGKAWKFLGDRNQDNEPELINISGKTLSFDTGKERNLCGVWLFTLQNPSHPVWKRPGHYEISISKDGIYYEKVFVSSDNPVNGFHAGPSIYVGGPWGKVEGLFLPVTGRYMKILFPDDSPQITELFVFETDGNKKNEFQTDIKKIIEIINKENIDFVLADRWVSARLLESFKGTNRKNIALARYSTRYKIDPLVRYVQPEVGKAVICDNSIATECEKVLVRQYGKKVVSKQFNLQNYTLFTLSDVPKEISLADCSELLWNGHLPLQTKDISLLVPLLNARGLPFWRNDLAKTKGIYHDSWTNGKGAFYNLNYSFKDDKEKELLIHTHGWRPDRDMSSLQLKVLINKNISLEFEKKTEQTYIFKLPNPIDRLEQIELQSTTFVPPSKDPRSLGIDIDYIEVR